MKKFLKSILLMCVSTSLVSTSFGMEDKPYYISEPYGAIATGGDENQEENQNIEPICIEKKVITWREVYYYAKFFEQKLKENREEDEMEQRAKEVLKQTKKGDRKDIECKEIEKLHKKREFIQKSIKEIREQAKKTLDQKKNKH